MFKRLCSTLVAGALLAAPAVVAPTASGIEIRGDFSKAGSKLEKCRNINNGIMAILSTQGTQPLVNGVYMNPINSKTKVDLEPSLHIKVKEGSKGVDLPLQWEWSNAMIRYAKLRESAKEINCEVTESQLYDSSAYRMFSSGKTAHDFVLYHGVKMNPYLFGAHNSVPDYISFNRGVVHISPKNVKRPQSAVVNLQIEVPGSEIPMPFITIKSKDYQLPIRITHLPKDSKIEGGVGTETKGGSSDNKGGSSQGGGLFDNLFSFSS